MDPVEQACVICGMEMSDGVRTGYRTDGTRDPGEYCCERCLDGDGRASERRIMDIYFALMAATTEKSPGERLWGD